MKLYFLSNFIFFIVFLVLGMGCLYGCLAGNYIHIVFVGACGYFCYLLYTDDEDGESIKQWLNRKLHKSKGE